MSVSDDEQHDLNVSEHLPKIPTEEYTGRRRRRRSRSAVGKWFKKIRRRLKFNLVLVTISVILLVVGVSLGILITDSVSDLRNSWQSLERVLLTVLNSDGTDLTLDDFNRLQSSTSEMEGQLSTTQQRLGLIGPLINLNSEWAVTSDALDVAQQLVSAANDMLEGAQPALTFMVADDTEEAVATRISSGARVVELLELGQGRFFTASQQLVSAEEALDSINLVGVSSDLLLQVEELRTFHQQLTSINEVLISSPEILNSILGLDEERSYLVLAQNNDELRPSGGYVSTYGWFTVESGRIMDYDYNPTTTTSPNPPSEQFLTTQNIIIPDWWIDYGQPVYAAWDGSWYADFPSTAEMAMSYYNAGDNPETPVDGVLAIDIDGFELMLGALGDVFVDAYRVTVTRENFRELVYDIRAFGEGVAPHKEFVASIYRSIFEEWSQLEQERTSDLLGALLEGFQQDHIMFYFADDNLNDVMNTLGWSAQQLAGTDSDYLMVVDANLGNKSNNSIDQPITYDVEIMPNGTLSSRLTVGFEYFDSIASSDPAVDAEFHGPIDYRSLLQIFLPLGSDITDTGDIGISTTIDTDTHTQLVTRSLIEYDTSERVQITYTAPAVTQSVGNLEVYRLLIQNQPGSNVQALNVQVRLPQGANLISSSPEADASYNLEQPIVDYRLELNGDIWIEIIFDSG